MSWWSVSEITMSYTANMRAWKNLLADTNLGHVCANYPIWAIDVGSRNGFDSDLEPIAFAVNFVGFEPDPAEFQRLEYQSNKGSDIWRSSRHVCVALSGTGGVRKLSIPKAPESASLLEHDPEIGRAFGKPNMFEISRVLEMETSTLDAVLDAHAIPKPHYVKIDVEGAELEILAAADTGLEDVLVIKTEVSFMPFRRHQPLAAEIDSFLRRRGFVLMDLREPMYWRRHSSAHVSHPQLARKGIPYSRGQLAHADYLYFRDPETMAPGDVAGRVRAATLATAFGYFDHAHALLSPALTNSLLNERFDFEVTQSIREASLIMGRHVWRAEFTNHVRRLGSFLRSARVAVFG